MSPQKVMLLSHQKSHACHPQRALFQSPQKSPAICHFPNGPNMSFQKSPIICNSKRALLPVTPMGLATCHPNGPCYLSLQWALLPVTPMCPATCHPKRTLLPVTPKGFCYLSPQKGPVTCHPNRTVTPMDPATCHAKKVLLLSPQKGPVTYHPNGPCQLPVIPKGPCYLSTQKGPVTCHPKRVLLPVTPKGLYYCHPKRLVYISFQKGPALCNSKSVFLPITPKTPGLFVICHLQSQSVQCNWPYKRCPQISDHLFAGICYLPLISAYYISVSSDCLNKKIKIERYIYHYKYICLYCTIYQEE